MIKKIKKKFDNKDLIKFFNQMTGVEDSDPTIIESKYDSLMYQMQLFLKAWDIFCASPFSQIVLAKDFNLAFEGIQKFVDEGKIYLKSLELVENPNKFKTTFTDSLADDVKEIVTKYDPALLNKNYREMKTGAFTTHVIKTLSIIKTLHEADKKKHNKFIGCLDNPETLSNTFFTKTELDTKLLSFSSLDFKFLYTALNKRVSEFDELVLRILRVTYMSATECYKIITTPDINVEKFVEAFSKKLKEAEKHIPNCGEAFKLLQKSLNLLKKNFDTYYMKYMQTNNPSVIFESFLEDVTSKTKKKNVLGQFNKIVEFVKQNIPEGHKNTFAVNQLFKYTDELLKVDTSI